MAKPSPSLIPVKVLKLHEPMYGPGLSQAGGEAINVDSMRCTIDLNPRGRFFIFVHNPGQQDEETVRIPMERVAWWQ